MKDMLISEWKKICVKYQNGSCGLGTADICPMVNECGFSITKNKPCEFPSELYIDIGSK